MKTTDYESDIILDYQNNSAIEILEDYEYDINDYVTLSLLSKQVNGDSQRVSDCLDFIALFKREVQELDSKEGFPTIEINDFDIKYYIYFDTNAKVITSNDRYVPDQYPERSDYFISYYGIKNTELPLEILNYMEWKLEKILSNYERLK